MAGGGEKKSGDNLVVLRFRSPGVLWRRRLVSLYLFFFFFFLNHVIIVYGYKILHAAYAMA